jgi:hypothetical protein
LFSIIENAGPINWRKVVVPGGRSAAAARFLIFDMKRKAGIASGNASKPKIPALTKRKRVTRAKEATEDGGDDVGYDGSADEKSSKFSKRVDKDVKEENMKDVDMEEY